MKPYLISKTYLSLLNSELLFKIEEDIKALERFSFKENEQSEKEHFKDVSRCLKQERFKDNYFFNDVFIHCKNEKISYYDSIKLILLKKQQELLNLTNEFAVNVVNDYKNYKNYKNSKNLQEIFNEMKDLKKIGINPDIISYHLIWFAKNNEDFSTIKGNIKNFEWKKTFNVSNEILNHNPTSIFKKSLSKEEFENIINNDLNCSNVLLSYMISNYSSLGCVNNENELIKKSFLRMFNYNCLLINQISAEEINVNIKNEASLFKSVLNKKNNPNKLKYNQKENKSIKMLVNEFNAEIDLFFKENNKKVKTHKIKCF